ncbi:MAG: WHG domain-containing protein [Acidobacteria bacterium]|nr:WHG domain-containing protein [Acidobacteriota bacterium]
MVTFGTPWPAPIACNDDAEAPTSSERAGLDCFAKLVAAVQRCIDAEQLPPGDTGLYAQIAWTSIHGLTSSLIVMKDDPHFPWAPREQLLGAMVNNVMAGLEAGAPSRAALASPSLALA